MYEKQPCYVISVAAKLVNMHPQTLRYYERLGLVKPSRSNGRIRLYCAADIERLQQIRRLIAELGVNLAGVEVILHLTERMRQMEQEMARLQGDLDREMVRLRRALELEGEEETGAAG